MSALGMIPFTPVRFKAILLKNIPDELKSRRDANRIAAAKLIPKIHGFRVISVSDRQVKACATIGIAQPETAIAMAVQDNGQLRWQMHCPYCPEAPIWCQHTLAVYDVAQYAFSREQGLSVQMLTGASDPNLSALVSPAQRLEPRAAQVVSLRPSPQMLPPAQPAPAAPNALDLSIDRWFGQLAQAATPEAAAGGALAPRGSQKSGRLVFLVSLVSVTSPWARIVLRSAFLPDGESLRTKRLLDIDNPQSQSASVILSNLSHEDRFRLQRFRGIRRDVVAGRTNYHPSNALDQELLIELVREGLCLFEDVDDPMGRPLQLATERSLDVQWTLTTSLASRLVVEPKRAHQHFIDLPRPMLVDHDTGVVTPLDVTQSMLRQLMNAPDIPVTHLEAFRSKWNAMTAGLALPPPDALGKVTTKTAKPKALVVLKPAKRALHGWQNFHQTQEQHFICADLSFLYGRGQVVHDAADLRIHVRDADGVVAYDRDIPTEQDVVQKIYAAGLAHVPEQRDIYNRYVGGFDFASRIEPQESRAYATSLIRRLSELGIRVEVAPELGVQFVEASGIYSDAEEVQGGRWVEIDIGVEIDGERLSLVDLAATVLKDPSFTPEAEPDEDPEAPLIVSLPDGRLMRITLAKAREALAPILEWIDFRVDSKEPIIRVPRTNLIAHAASTGELPAVVDWPNADRIHSAARAIRDGSVREVPITPEGFLGELRHYQQDGVRWLLTLEAAALGGILADDMGLGKTVQLLASIAMSRRREPGQAPVLLAMPTSLVENWKCEAQKFTPDLRVLTLHGPDRASLFEDISNADIVITTYPLLWRDIEQLKPYRFSLALFDEANAMKKDTGATRDAVLQLQFDRAMIITGTPIENSLAELWSFIDVALPGLLGSKRQFTKTFRTPIERKSPDEEARGRLARRVKPFILRRRKEDVLKDLPPKTVVVRNVTLSDRARKSYDALHTSMSVRVRDAIAERGLSQSKVTVLNALTNMSLFCCHPKLVEKEDRPSNINVSDKLISLMEMVNELVADGRRILIFSQYVSFLKIIDTELRKHAIEPLMLHGETKNRGKLVRQFQDGHCPVFLISLRAGGVGLNLTRADTVIIASPWWNGAAEQQAGDRAHRIGQENPVFVYKVIVSDTIEDHVMVIQGRKTALAAAILDEGSTSGAIFDAEDIDMLFKK